jgi:hypothetical protein
MAFIECIQLLSPVVRGAKYHCLKNAVRLLESAVICFSALAEVMGRKSKQKLRIA